MTRTIEIVKEEIAIAYDELEILQEEYAAIIAIRTINTDLTKSLDDFLRLAEKLYLENKNTYDDQLRSQEQKIKLKNSQIRSLHEEAKRILFITNEIQQSINEPEAIPK